MYYAQSGAGFEHVALRFLEKKEMGALVAFLRKKLDVLKKTVSALV